MASRTPSTSGKKATANTEIVLGAAAQQISKAVTELGNATNTISQLASQAADLTLLVANKEEAIQSLETEYAEKERQLKVDLELSFKSNTDKVVSSHLSSIGHTSISTSELQALRTELETARTSTEKTVKSEVASAVASVKSTYESEIKLLHAENKAVTAENSARITSLTSENSFLQSQVDKLYGQLNSEREAGISRAQAGAVGSINVSSPSK